MTARKTTKTPHPVLSEDAIHLVAARFRALGDPSRIRLLNLLMQSESSVQELVEASGMTQTNVSRHLGLLRREGVVVRKKEGKRAVYRIADPHVEELCLLVCGAIQTHLSEGLGALQGQGI
jgi:DNA-binding transcriptional ArsR family regulator